MADERRMERGDAGIFRFEDTLQASKRCRYVDIEYLGDSCYFLSRQRAMSSWRQYNTNLRAKDSFFAKWATREYTLAIYLFHGSQKE